MKAVVIQLNGSPDVDANLGQVERLVEDACSAEHPDLISLPEMVTSIGGDREVRLAAAETFPEGRSYRLLQNLAQRHSVVIHAGSLLEAGAPGRCFNTAVLFDRKGVERARYRKLHLFDVTTPSGRSYKESSQFDRGDEVVAVALDDVRYGLSICYDLRFAELYRALADQGADILFVPAAFTVETGRDHWEVLLRARAIETQCWVVAAAQWGQHGESNRRSYGHSLVVDPWGHVTARLGEGAGWFATRLDLERVRTVRAQIPVRNHRVLT